MNRLKRITVLHYILLAYLVLYILFIEPWNGVEFSALTPELTGVYLAFVLFLIGFSFAWTRPVVTGIIFLAWNALMWVIEWFFVEKDGGFGILSGVPLLVMGVLFILQAYRKRVPKPGAENEWKLAINLLAVIFTVLYGINILANYYKRVYFVSIDGAGIYLLILLAVYLAGLLLIRKHEMMAAVLFFFWYIALLVVSMQYQILEFERITALSVVVLGLLLIHYKHNIVKKGAKQMLHSTNSAMKRE